MGTDLAFNIVVRDTLSSKADWNTFEMMSASHGYTLSIEDGDKLTWTFNNIDLPYSSLNEPASHGYITYRIRPKSTVAVGDTIHNTASIYFDYNLPVLTNNAFTLIQEPIVLPLRLISFTGSLYNDEAVLNWLTSDEYNFEKFVIERSSNDRDFEAIATNLSNGNLGNRNNYQFKDNLANQTGNIFYYRIKMIDNSGAYTYSSIISLRRNSRDIGLQVYPNPVKNGIATIVVNQPVEGIATIRLIDLSGRIVSSFRQYLRKGQTSMSMENIHHLSPGIYYLQVINSKQIKTNKIVIEITK